MSYSGGGSLCPGLLGQDAQHDLPQLRLGFVGGGDDLFDVGGLQRVGKTTSVTIDRPKTLIPA